VNIYTIEHTGESFMDWANLGDDIQALAAQRLVPEATDRIPKGELDKAMKSGIVLMNGFFLGGAGWPPAEGLVPLFYSFHISTASQDELCSEKNLAYLRRFGPVGCRDRGTMYLLQSNGVSAYHSGCLSLTLPRRPAAPKEGKVFLVSLCKGAESAVPRRIRKQAVVVDQAKLRLPSLDAQKRETLAQHLLDVYAKEASLVITSKIHCAMPCIAMGIPVVFLYDRKKKKDRRVEVIKDLVGINYLGKSLFSRRVINPLIGRFIDWMPEPLDIEEEKKHIRDGCLAAIQRTRCIHEGLGL
jgi:hypothetical protein